MDVEPVLLLAQTIVRGILILETRWQPLQDSKKYYLRGYVQKQCFLHAIGYPGHSLAMMKKYS